MEQEGDAPCIVEHTGGIDQGVALGEGIGHVPPHFLGKARADEEDAGGRSEPKGSGIEEDGRGELHGQGRGR